MRSSSLHLVVVVVVVVDARRIHISEGWITTGGRLADGIAETAGRGEGGGGRTVMPVQQIYDYA